MGIWPELLPHHTLVLCHPIQASQPLYKHLPQKHLPDSQIFLQDPDSSGTPKTYQFHRFSKMKKGKEWVLFHSSFPATIMGKVPPWWFPYLLAVPHGHAGNRSSTSPQGWWHQQEGVFQHSTGSNSKHLPALICLLQDQLCGKQVTSEYRWCSREM